MPTCAPRSSTRAQSEASLDEPEEPATALATARAPPLHDPVRAGARRTPRSSSSPPPTPPARSARSPASASPGRARASASTRWRSPTAIPTPTARIIESVFQEARVPVYLHEGTPMSERPLGRRVIALLELIDSDFERRAVTDFLADGRLPEDTWEKYGEPKAADWDRFSRAAGVVRGIEQWEQRLTAHADEARALRPRVGARRRASRPHLPSVHPRPPLRPLEAARRGLLVRAPRPARRRSFAATSTTRSRSSTPSTASAASTRSTSPPPTSAFARR